MSEPGPLTDARAPHEQYESFDRQERVLKLGFFAFLASETLLFAALIALYAAYRVEYGAEFARGMAEQYHVIGLVNTLILLSSSLLVALGVHAMRIGRGAWTAVLYALAVAMGGAFLSLKAIEWGGHAAKGLLPGRSYSSVELPGAGAKLFFTLYYFLTGLHALHVTAGMGALGWIAWRAWRGRTYTPRRHLTVELAGLYWHLVDVIWIFLWPLFYRSP